LGDMVKYMRILIVDDHAVLREGLASLLDHQPDFEVVGEAGTMSDAVMKAGELKPDLILMDISLPDGSGLEATRAILKQAPDTNIVILTIHDSDELLMDAIRNGARGYLMKNTSSKDLITSLRALRRGELALTREMAGRVISGFSSDAEQSQKRERVVDQLTSRELEVLMEVSSGATNKEIAERLFISVNTVKNHVHDILDKLGLKNRREATLFAIRHRLNKPVSK